jgi:DNA (cytosine-5)-methyltransferase 1
VALSPFVRPIAYCEKDRFAQAVLLSRMQRGELPTAGIWDDVTTLLPELLPREEIDIIYGGFPCQDISTAGIGTGLEGKRSGLFFEIIRLCRDIRPRFVFLENVPAITVRGLDRVCLEFASIGYDCRWTIVSAASVGAHHRRDRWWLLAHANGEPVRLSESGQRREKIHDPRVMENGKDPNSTCSGLQSLRKQIGYGEKQPFSLDLLEGDNWDEYASFFHRMDNGIPNRGHRLRGLGNAVVPQQARAAFMKLVGRDYYKN